MDEIYDVVVVGGGAAGLSGAVALARSCRSVLVIDAGDPRNARADQVHSFLTRDGTPPAEIYAVGRGEVTRYGGRVETGRVTALSRDGGRFRVQIGSRSVAARRLLVASGLRDELPEVPGLAARWGVDVLHCPYCHGWEVAGKRLGILATGPAAIHQALLFRQLSPHVTLLQHIGAAPAREQREHLDGLGIAVTEGKVEKIEADASGLTGVRLAGGRRAPLDAGPSRRPTWWPALSCSVRSALSQPRSGSASTRWEPESKRTPPAPPPSRGCGSPVTSLTSKPTS